MANNGGPRASAPGKNNSLVAGILIGMVLGLGVAGGVAWYITKSPSPFVNKEQREAMPTEPAAPAAPTPKPAAPAVAAPAPAASGVGDGKPRFEFYKILTDKEGAAPAPKKSPRPVAPAPTPAPAPAAKEPAQPSAQGTPYFLQAGSFTTADDADKLKARLALIGMEASVQTADIPGKGVYYRVRLGPYRNTDDLNKANATLKQNGIRDAAPVRAQ